MYFYNFLFSKGDVFVSLNYFIETHLTLQWK